MANDWVKEIDIAITVSDKNGKFLEMNDKSKKTFEKDGGENLINSEIMNCHNENSKEIIRKIVSENKSNVYFVEKEGKRKLIFQAPWTKEGEFQGLVELSIVIPPDIETKVRG